MHGQRGLYNVSGLMVIRQVPGCRMSIQTPTSAYRTGQVQKFKQRDLSTRSTYMTFIASSLRWSLYHAADPQPST